MKLSKRVHPSHQLIFLMENLILSNFVPDTQNFNFSPYTESDLFIIRSDDPLNRARSDHRLFSSSSGLDIRPDYSRGEWSKREKTRSNGILSKHSIDATQPHHTQYAALLRSKGKIQKNQRKLEITSSAKKTNNNFRHELAETREEKTRK